MKSVVTIKPKPARGRPGGNPAAMGKKGEPSHNPLGGPPKERNINRILREIGKECASGVEGARTRLEVVLRRVFVLAQRGEPWAVNFIADRTEGKPAQVMVQAGAFYSGGEAPRDLNLQDLIDLVQRLSGGALNAGESEPMTIDAVATEQKKAVPTHASGKVQPS